MLNGLLSGRGGVLGNMSTPVRYSASQSTRAGILRATLKAEFSAWRDLPRRPRPEGLFPPLDHEGGLPAGWQVQVEAPLEQVNSWSVAPSVALVRREAGGWLIVNHLVHPKTSDRAGGTETLFGQGEPTLSDLYALICAAADTTRDHYWAAPIEEMMRAFIAEHYNLDDPTEAAEATLVALGGRPQLMPTALARGDDRA